MQAGDDRHVDVARPAAAAFGEQHHRQPLAARDGEQTVGLLVVAHALRSGEHRRVVGHDDGTRALGAEGRAVDAADAGDHPVGRRVAQEVVELAPAPLRRERETTVLDEAARIAEIGDVLARGAQAERMAACDGVGPARIDEQRFARAQFEQVGAQRCAIGIDVVARARRRRLRIDRSQQREHVAGGDDVGDAAAHRLDHAVRRGTHLVLHLHRLDHRDKRAAGDVLPVFDRDLDDASRERRDDADARHGRPPQAKRTAPG